MIDLRIPRRSEIKRKRCSPSQSAKSATRFAGESGQSAVELVALLPVMLLIALVIFQIGPLVSIHIAILTAANDCAVTAAQTLDPQQAQLQGRAAAQETLSGYRLRSGAASISVSGGGARGAPVTCSISYSANLSSVFGVFLANEVHYAVSLPAQAYKSVWK